VTGWQTTASLCFYAVFAATAAIRDGFGVSRAMVGLAATAALVGYTAGLVPAGALVDGYGERPAMVGGLCGLAAGVTAVGLAPTYPLLLAALAVVGVAYATAMPATNRAVLTVAPVGHRNLAVNVKQVGVTAGSGASALLVTAAVDRTGTYTPGFLAIGGVAICVAAAFGLWYRRSAAPDDDGASTADTAERSGPSTPDPRRVLGLPGVAPLVAAGAFFGAAVFSTTAYVVLHVTESAGASTAFGGAVLAGVQATGSVGRLGAGALADRLPGSVSRSTAGVLVAQAVLAAVAFVAVPLAGTRWTTAAAFGVLGLFILGFPGTYYACLTSLVPDDRVGAATAAGQTTLNLGGLLAPPAVGLLIDATGYGPAWLALGGFALAAGALVVPVVLGDDDGRAGPDDRP
jgi:predicted MFS family arabinose efflux permease